MNVEDVEYHGFKGICGDEAMVCSKQATFVVAPSLDLRHNQFQSASSKVMQGVNV